MRKLLIALALLLGMGFILTRMTDLQAMGAVLQRGNLIFLALALVVEGAWLYNLGAFYQSIYRVLGMEEKRTTLARLANAAFFVSVVAPSGGLSGIAIFIADARRTGRSIARVTVAGTLFVWFEYIGTLSLLTLGLAELSRRNNLHWSEITASLILLAGGLGIGLLLYLGMKSASALGKALAMMARAVNAALRPFLHRDYLAIERAHSFSNEIAEGISALRDNPRWAIRPFVFSLINKALLFLVLLFCFLAFKIPVDAGTLVAGLSIGHLFLIVSPTPAGLGIVEGVLAVALTGLGIPAQDAAVVTLAYRGFSFWVPLLTGMAATRMLARDQKVEIPVTA